MLQGFSNEFALPSSCIVLKLSLVKEQPRFDALLSDGDKQAWRGILSATNSFGSIGLHRDADAEGKMDTATQSRR